MREILFKAQRADTREWVEGYLWSKRTIGYTSPCGNTDEIVIDPETVCQYTGLTDKNGKKIFEGDKCIYPAEYGGTVYVIRWDHQDCRFFASDVKHNGIESFGDFFSEHCEVIGNIHDKEEEK